MRLSLMSVFLLSTAPAFAADVSVTSKVAEVTVYPDAATVSRVIEFEAVKGETTLIAKDFPLGLDPASLRVKGSAEGGAIEIGSVDAKMVPVEAKQPDAEFLAKLEELNDQKAAVQGEQSALQTKKSMIERIARSADMTGAKTDDKVVDPGALRSVWNAVGEDLAQINEAIRQQSVKLRAIDKEIARLTAERNRPLTATNQQMEVRVALTASDAAKGAVTVSYKVNAARWTPLYDARLDTQKNELEIVRQAEISQQTGEDWTDAELTVSTALANAGAQAPRLGAMVLTFDENRLIEGLSSGKPDGNATTRRQWQDAEEQLAVGNRMSGREAAAPVQDAPGVPPVLKSEPLVQRHAQLDTGGFQSSWKVPGRNTIPSGPATRLLRLASSKLSPKIVARAVPSLQQTAFLEAAFDHGEDTPLFPGRVSVYRDGLYTGDVLMPLATKTEPVRLGFGADDRIRVERVPTRKIENDSAKYLRSSREEYKISLRNGGSTAISVTVEEATPVTENTDIKVEMLPVTTQGFTKNDDDRRGVLSWTVELEPAATKTIMVGYKIVWPTSREISRTTAPNLAQ